jgi:uncharacterized protein (DUF3820 family)
MSDVLPFGKYKGMSLTEIAARDSEYLEWCSQQDGLRERYPQFFQLVVNVLQPKTDETPEHNEMQVRFLDETHCARVAWLCGAEAILNNGIHTIVRDLTRLKDSYHREYASHYTQEKIAALEEEIARFKSYQSAAAVVSKVDFESFGWDVRFYVRRGSGADLELGVDVHVELKTSIGSDYPAVLRQMSGRELRGYKLGGSLQCCVVKNWQGGNVTFDQAQKIFATKRIVLLMEADTVA